MIIKIFEPVHEVLTAILFQYETPRIVTIRNIKIGLLHRFLQLAIVGYVLGYAIIYKKGYQEKDIGLSTVVTKVKGSSSSLNRHDLPEYYRSVWDTPDYVIPPLMKDAVFISTNLIITPRQHFSECPEDPNVSSQAQCSSNSDCIVGQFVEFGNGELFKKLKRLNCRNGDVLYCKHDKTVIVLIHFVHGEMTGVCVPSDRLPTKKTCQIKAWCPVENDSPRRSFFRPLISDVSKFSIFLKNTVEFTKFNEKYRNVDLLSNNYNVKNCFYDEVNDPKCPKFLVGDIIKHAHGNLTKLSIYGGVINIFIQWHCDLDYSIKTCVPKYKFSQTEKAENEISPGFNFRYANYYRNDSGTLFRDLMKSYGILFVFNVEATAGRFSFSSLALNIGAGLALLGLARILIDMMLIYVYKNKKVVREHKFLTVSLNVLKKQNKRYAKNASVY